MRTKTLVTCLILAAAFAFQTAAMADGEVTTEEVKGQAREILHKVVNYVPNVFMDFVDMFKADIAIGEGVGFDARFTRLLAVGQSDYDVTRYGLNGRHTAIYDEDVNDAGVGLFGFTLGELERDPYEIGVTVQLFAAGPQVAFNVRKAVDFVAGIFMIDIEEDNVEYF